MPQTMEQINAEKRAKARPDLIPAEVLEGFFNALTELVDERGGTEPEDYDDMDPTFPLLSFAQTGDVEFVYRAMAETAGRRIARGQGSHALAMGRVLAYGLAKHGVCTWRVAGTEQADPQTHYASALRHMLEDFADSDAVEEGSGFPVLDHALTQLAILADLTVNPPQAAGTNDGQWAIVTARKPAAQAEDWTLPDAYEWEVDENQRTNREFIKSRPLGPGGAVWLDEEGRLYGSLQRDPALVAILRRRHGVKA